MPIEPQRIPLRRRTRHRDQRAEMTTRICALHSCTTVLRLALVAKRRQALGEVFAADVPGKGVNFRLIPVIAIRVETGARKAFDLRKHFRALLGELQGDVLGARKKLRRGHDFVDEAPLRKLARENKLALKKSCIARLTGIFRNRRTVAPPAGTTPYFA